MMDHDGGWQCPQRWLPSGDVNSWLLKMAIEIVDLPIENMVFFHINSGFTHEKYGGSFHSFL